MTYAMPGLPYHRSAEPPHGRFRVSRFEVGSLGLTLMLLLPMASFASPSMAQDDSSSSQGDSQRDSDTRADHDPQDDDAADWKTLFDGESLDGWKSAVFGGEGEVVLEDNAILMKMGVSLTGVTYQGEVPRSNYEIELEAKLVDGIDFFCGLTFPVKEEYCSFIVGGWAGSVVGLSSIDGMDASENETTSIMRFDDDRWYRIRVRVQDDRIQCWIDDERVVDQSIEGRALSIRPEVSLSRPLGISAWQTTAALRDIRIRKLEDR